MYFHRVIVALGACAVFAGVAMAQVQATRTTSFDWQCQDANGDRISDHQREGTAIVACLNAPNGAYVQGGRYRINRTAPTAGTATLDWVPRMQNIDGTPLTNLAGYRISYGTSAAALTQAVQVASPSASTYTIGNLAPGTYYFTVRAYTSNGTESAQSNIASKVIL